MSSRSAHSSSTRRGPRIRCCGSTCSGAATSQWGTSRRSRLYAGLAILFFFLFIFLQEVAGYSALKAGLTTVPSTLIMFVLSSRMGALADRFGPRLFMTAGPLISAAGILLFLRAGIETSFVYDLLPALIVFSLGLAVMVAPLTATVLADADESDAGIASAINNAIARVAGLVGISAIGAVVAGRLTGDTFAPNGESVRAFHEAIVICAALVAAGGVVAAFGIQNPQSRGQRRRVPRRAVRRHSPRCRHRELTGASRGRAVRSRLARARRAPRPSASRPAARPRLFRAARRRSQVGRGETARCRRSR